MISAIANKTPSPTIGWDIGGAHLKGARVSQAGVIEAAVQVPCPLWRGMAELQQALDFATAELGSAKSHAVTMTGEMVDLFPDRETGVIEIARALQKRFAHAAVQFYCGQRTFVELGDVDSHVEKIASANWRATVEFLSVSVERGVLVDIGSTTTDIVAIENHRIVSKGLDDYSRLVAGELVYSGVVRTPLMALTDQVEFLGIRVPIVAEHFATTADVYRVLGTLPDDVDLHPSADGAAKTPLASARRLARMIGRDVASANFDDWQCLARAFRAAQLAKIQVALDAVAHNHSSIVGAGIGEFLIREMTVVHGWRYRSFVEYVKLNDGLANKAAYVAPAIAVALLAQAS